LYNFPFLKYSYEICKEAVVRFALSMSSNRREASMILGMKKADFIKYIKEYGITDDFDYSNKRK
jgi:hypothetical protein